MKSLIVTLMLTFATVSALAQSPQSPLAPPKLPPPAPASVKLKVGDLAPGFSLPNGDGQQVLLSEYTARSPVVLIFYRGYWCGACTQQLTKLAEDYDKFKQAGADLIAISADVQAFAWSTGQTLGAHYQILSDSDRKVITSYGVLNPTEHDGIAHPSVFIVDKDGRIKYLHVGKDPQDRPSDETILEEVKKVTGAK